MANEDQKTGLEPKEKKRNWREVIDTISYKGLVRNTPYLIFLTFLIVIYINNSNRAVAIVRDLNEKNKELKELRWKYRDLEARLMALTSETEITNKSLTEGIKPPVHPAFEIEHKIKDTVKEEN